MELISLISAALGISAVLTLINFFTKIPENRKKEEIEITFEIEGKQMKFKSSNVEETKKLVRELIDNRSEKIEGYQERIIEFQRKTG